MRSGDARFNTDFSKDFERRNRLSEQGFLQWAFFPGMLFKSRVKWWGDMGGRQTPHEGLDLGFFLGRSGRVVPIPHRAVVPVMFQGEILPFGEDDFFGVTLYVKHPEMKGSGKVLCTIYGHVTPLPGIYPGRIVLAGDSIASVSDFGKPKSGITAHLHLSVAWMAESSAMENLTWKKLNDPSQVRLMDPMAFLGSPHSVVSAEDHLGFASRY